ncbi:MAG: ornithine cyclodeaminase family protein, partial [Verrucomicrobiota bacterium]
MEKSDIVSVIDRLGLDNTMQQVIDRLQRAIEWYDPEAIDIAARQGFQYEQTSYGLLEWMPACDRNQGTVIKIVGYHPANPTLYQLPSVLSSLYSFDIETGHLKALMDGTLLTAIRTGAASAVASRLLADPSSETLCVVGCGAQAVTQIHALWLTFPLKQILAFDTDPDAAASLSQRLPPGAPPVVILEHDDLVASLQRSDLICTCTSARPGDDPVVPMFDPLPHLHINAVGSDAPGKIELPLPLLQSAEVFPDMLEQAVHEGECQQLDPNHIGPTLAELVQSAGPEGCGWKKTTVFDSTGWAFEDKVIMELFLELAEEFELGR